MPLNKKGGERKEADQLELWRQREKMEEAPLCSFSGMIPMWYVSFSRLVWLVTKMMTTSPENMDHENNDPEAGQASIPAVLFWEHNTPKLPNIQYVYWCTSILHCQTPLWCLLLFIQAPLPAYAQALYFRKNKTKNIRDPITGLRSNYRQLKSFIWYE